MFLIICIVALIILLFVLNNKKEHFEDIPTEYRALCPKHNRLTNIPEFMANSWHLRFPYMVNQKYSYDDMPGCDSPFPSLHSYAQLKELPLHHERKTLNISGYDHGDYYDSSFSQDPP